MSNYVEAALQDSADKVEKEARGEGCSQLAWSRYSDGEPKHRSLLIAIW